MYHCSGYGAVAAGYLNGGGGGAKVPEPSKESNQIFDMQFCKDFF